MFGLARKGAVTLTGLRSQAGFEREARRETSCSRLSFQNILEGISQVG